MIARILWHAEHYTVDRTSDYLALCDTSALKYKNLSNHFARLYAKRRQNDRLQFLFANGEERESEGGGGG